jgi:hypothetical protein
MFVNYTSSAVLHPSTTTATGRLFSPLLRRVGIPFKCTFTPPDRDVLDNPFVKVVNVGFDPHSLDLISTIPLKEIARSVHKKTVVKSTVTSGKKKKDPTIKSAPKRQQYHIDVG